ncbi:MAG: LamG-like jellyroll fold domain-containing protein [Akkermansiaceae bacterium]
MHTVKSCGILALSASFAFGQGQTLKDELVAYWPLDEIQGNKTPDLANGQDFLLQSVGATDQIPGKFGMAFNFKKANKAHLVRTHDPADDLPAMKNESFTLAYWVRANAAGQSDLRFFSEGSNLPSDGTPLFTMGTVPGGSNNSVDVFIRDKNGFPLFNHTPTGATPLDGLDWHHVAFVQTAQPDGSATRQVYIDGVLDSIAIPNKPAGYTHNMNTTSIAAVVRTSDVAHVDGDIDEVVIWKRPLTQAELDDLITNGMPDLDEQQEELQINSFAPEFRKVASGDEVTITWDATKDATLEIDQGIGDVTATSEFGVGSTRVVITEETTFTLTASRDGEASVTQTLTVSPITGVASGWNWIDDFDGLTPGALSSQGSWLTAEGSWEVTTIGNTQAITATAGTDLTGRITQTHALQEDSTRTLFFRFCYSSAEADFPVLAKVGFGEKAIRFAVDYVNNIGTYVTFRRDIGGPLRMEAIDGIGGPVTDSGITFEPDTSYDVWIDVNNVPLDQTDTFSVHVAPTGGTRQTVFDNFSSDREPQEVFLLGFPRPIIDTIFVTTTNVNDLASQAIAFDDFYISDAESNPATAPVAPGFGKILPADLVIKNMTFDPVTQQLSLTWDSQANTTYRIVASTDLSADSWSEIQDNVASQGASTTESLTLALGQTFDRLFFRVEVQ